MSDETQTDVATDAAPRGDGEPQTRLRIDQGNAQSAYAGVAMVSATAEEFVIDFAEGVRRTDQPNVNAIKVEQRIIMSPWAAKRLLNALGQEISRYEEAFGALDLERSRRAPTPTNRPASDGDT